MNPPFSATRVLLSTAAISMGVGMSLAAPVAAANFTYQDDPNSSALKKPGTQTVVDGNFRRSTLLGVDPGGLSTTGQLPDLIFVTPFAWVPLGDGSLVNMTWNNHRKGWYTDNYDGTSLLIELADADGYIPMGNIADIEGLGQYPLTQPCAPASNPSCAELFYPTDTTNPNPSQTRTVGDKVPFINLKSADFAIDPTLPSKPPFNTIPTQAFDVTLKLTFGDGRGAALPPAPDGKDQEVQLYSFTASRIAAEEPSTSVPEPASGIAVAAAGGVALLLQQRRKDQGLIDS
jgi:hypothetical protein